MKEYGLSEQQIYHQIYEELYIPELWIVGHSSLDKAQRLDLRQVKVLANLTDFFADYVKEFKYTPPPTPFDGKIACGDKFEKMIYQAFACEYEPNPFLLNHNNLGLEKYVWKDSDGKWVFPSQLLHPEDFKEEIKKYLEQTYGNDKDLIDHMNAIYYDEKDWDRLAQDFRESYWDMIYLKSTRYSSGGVDLSDKCKASSIRPSTKQYYCFDKDQEKEISLSYTNTEQDTAKYKTIPSHVRDQNKFGFVVHGDLAATDSPNRIFPRYIAHGETEKIEFQKKCYEANISLVSYDPRYPLPTVKGIGKLPDDCKKTGVCIVHWCGEDDTITLSAGTRKESVRLMIYSSRNGVLEYLTNVNGGVSNLVLGSGPDWLNVYCLRQGNDDSLCPNDELTFQSPAIQNVPSKQSKRGSITLQEKIAGQISVDNIRKCFDFPYEWNFAGYKTKMNGQSSVDNFHKDDFEVPLNVIQETELKFVDIAHDVGAALALYTVTINQNDEAEAQVCSKDNPRARLPLPLGWDAADVNQAIISDSGTVVAIQHINEVHIFELDKVQDEWIQVTTITGFSSIKHFGLSTHGHFIAILHNNNVDLYQKDLDFPTYSRKSKKAVPVHSHHDQVSVYASESGVVSVQVRATNGEANTKTFEVSSSFKLSRITTFANQSLPNVTFSIILFVQIRTLASSKEIVNAAMDSLSRVYKMC